MFEQSMNHEKWGPSIFPPTPEHKKLLNKINSLICMLFDTQKQRYRHPKTLPATVLERSRSHSRSQAPNNKMCLWNHCVSNRNNNFDSWKLAFWCSTPTKREKHIHPETLARQHWKQNSKPSRGSRCTCRFFHWQPRSTVTVHRVIVRGQRPPLSSACDGPFAGGQLCNPANLAWL